MFALFSRCGPLTPISKCWALRACTEEVLVFVDELNNPDRLSLLEVRIAAFVAEDGRYHNVAHVVDVMRGVHAGRKRAQLGDVVRPNHLLLVEHLESNLASYAP